MRFFKWINRLAGRLNRWIGPTIAADSMMREGGGMGGTHVDPLALDLLNLQLHRDESDEPSR